MEQNEVQRKLPAYANLLMAIQHTGKAQENVRNPLYGNRPAPTAASLVTG